MKLLIEAKKQFSSKSREEVAAISCSWCQRLHHTRLWLQFFLLLSPSNAPKRPNSPRSLLGENLASRPRPAFFWNGCLMPHASCLMSWDSSSQIAGLSGVNAKGPLPAPFFLTRVLSPLDRCIGLSKWPPCCHPPLSAAAAFL